MKKRNIDWSDLSAVTRFAEVSAVRLAKDIAKEAMRINPDLLISNNYPSYEELSGINTYFDVMSLPASDWSKYKVLIFLDDILFDEETARRVKKHVNEGKAVISTGFSGLDPEKRHFVLEQEWGIKFLGENPFDPAYFTVGENCNKGLPDMPLSLYSNGIEVEASGKTRTEARLVKPYHNRDWDGEYAFYYNPPDKVTEKPALTINGQVAHFSHRIFSGYYDKASVELRTFTWHPKRKDCLIPSKEVMAISMYLKAKDTLCWLLKNKRTTNICSYEKNHYSIICIE